MMNPITHLTTCVWLVAASFSGIHAEAIHLSPLRTVPKPDEAAHASMRHARSQPSVPDNYTAIPFVEAAPIPILTVDEEERGYVLFQRSITEPVHPNTRPLAHERLQDLVAFATPGEFEPLTFSIYPIRDLKNLRVRASALRSDTDEIPSPNLTIQLATYWNVGYPRYTSRDTYRRVPELLERVTVHSSPAKECQRWWITCHVPEDTPPALYRGTVTVWDDGYDKAIQIPVALRVLSFKLQSDPAKRYSVYYYSRNGVQFGDRDEEFIRRAMGNEYKAMVGLGIDMCPTLYLRVDRGQGKIIIQHVEELERMLVAGLSGPIPVAGGNAIEAIYRETTPDGKRESHWKIDKMPPPEFYQRVTEMFRALEEDRRAKGWPELICCPLDEVDASRKEFGSRVYKAVRDAGIRTYITKNPLAADATDYRAAVDIWCSQPYSEPYEKIVAQDRYEYWCYPNHNAGEVKDRRVMCKGGRMTYGFGFWRSGYTTLIPWHWAWTPAPDQFDYLRGSRSGCGQRIGDDGEVIPAIYWECFREGRDDARYLYTLQQAIWEREKSTDLDCLQLVTEGQELLQEMWNDIEVQQKYLADGMWPSEEFNARRWRLATLTECLLRYPAVRQGTVPSVLVADTDPVPSKDETDFIADAIQQEMLEARDLGGDFSEWVNGTSEGKLSVTTEAGRDGRKGLRWEVEIDHQVDGGEGGDYPIGWPRVARSFGAGKLDMSRFDYLLFQMRVDSDRDEVADDHTPIGFTIGSSRLFEGSRDLGGRQRIWLPILFPIRSMIDARGRGEAPWQSVDRLQFFIAERNYADGTNLTFDIAEVSLLRFKSPMISRIDVPQFVMLPQSVLPVGFELMGTRSVGEGSHTIEAALTDDHEQTQAEAVQDLAASDMLLLDTSQLQPGNYTLRIGILTADGKHSAASERRLVGLPGPLFDE